MGESIEISLNPPEAYATRDAIAKLIFKNLFAWIVEKINDKISNNQNNKQNSKFIGILDIFGFEIFDHNSFE